MKIRFLKLVLTFVTLLLLAMQASSIDQIKTSAISVPSSPSFASIINQGDHYSTSGDRPSATLDTRPGTTIIESSLFRDERDAVFSHHTRSINLADDPLPSLARSRHKTGYSISGQITDINERPIPDVTLSISGVGYVTTDTTGHYRVTNLADSTYTITPIKAIHSFEPPRRTVDLQTNGREQNFTVEPDLGFRPERDGYSFNNPGTATPDCQAFQRSFSGIDIKCSGDQPQLQYLDLYERYKFSFRTGICTGMAATSLAYYVRLATRHIPTSGLSFNDAWPEIAAFHGRQYSKAVLDRRIAGLSAWNTKDANVLSRQVDHVYHQLRLALQPGNPDPVVLDLVSRLGCEPSGHTVTPYRLDETDPIHPKVYIYENYSAGDSSKFIQFDFSSSEHRFSYWKWDSVSCGALVAIPISAFTSLEDKVPSAYLGSIP